MTNKRKARVLAIDDEPAMTEWLKTVIENEGYEVRTALIGTRGEELFKQWRPDVVVTDLMLPDLDGIELLQTLQGDRRRPEVIVISGHGTMPRAVEARQAGRLLLPREAGRARTACSTCSRRRSSAAGAAPSTSSSRSRSAASTASPTSSARARR